MRVYIAHESPLPDVVLMSLGNISALNYRAFDAELRELPATTLNDGRSRHCGPLVGPKGQTAKHRAKRIGGFNRALCGAGMNRILQVSLIAPSPAVMRSLGGACSGAIALWILATVTIMTGCDSQSSRRSKTAG